MVEKCHGEMDVSEFNAVRSIVRRTRRKSAHLRAMEEDDLLQDCMLHWLRVRGGLDLATVRNPAAFMRRVLENKLRDLARNAHTEKRGLALQVPSKSFDSEHRSPNFMVREALESPGWECEFDQPAAAIDLARAIGEPRGCSVRTPWQSQWAQEAPHHAERPCPARGCQRAPAPLRSDEPGNGMGE